MSMYYTGFVHKDADSDFSVSFPDLPGCISAGSTLEEALHNASEALTAHVQWICDDGDLIPPARSPDQLTGDRTLAEVRVDAILIALPVLMPAMLPPS